MKAWLAQLLAGGLIQELREHNTKLAQDYWLLEREMEARNATVRSLQEEMERLRPREEPAGRTIRCTHCRSERFMVAAPFISVEVYSDRSPRPVGRGVTVRCRDCLKLFHVEDDLVEAKDLSIPPRRTPQEKPEKKPPDADLRFRGPR